MQDSQTNTFNKGMNLDIAKEYIGADQYIYAMDVHVTGDGSSSGALQAYDELYEYSWGKLPFEFLDSKILGLTNGKIYVDDTITECFIALTRDNADTTNILWVFSQPPSKIDENSFEGFYPRLKFKLKFDFGINTAAKLINVYENRETSRVYIAAEGSMIQVVNINATYPTDLSNRDFSIFPKCGILKPFRFDAEVTGNLTAGKYQYAYQLFNRDGQTSALSVISHPILVGAEAQGDQTQIGIRLKLDTTGVLGEWEYMRIYAIVYLNSTDVPQVYIKSETAFSKNQKSYYWIDGSSAHLSTITLEEFNAIKNSVFTANTIEVKDNIMFAAGILFQDFDVDFDARAYPADENGWVHLRNQSDELKIFSQSAVKAGTVDIAEDYDCIPGDPDVYKYNTIHGKTQPSFSLNRKFVYPHGGVGPNVEYMFEHPLFYLAPFSAKKYQVTDPGDTTSTYGSFQLLSTELTEKHFSDVKRVDEMRIVYPKVDSSDWIYAPKKDIDCSHTISDLNHKDTYICANYTGFKQGEIYRFGIIFYSNRMQRSPVHWIGDITIPREDWIFNSVPEKDNDGVEWCHDLVTAGTGITFKIDISKIKSDIVGYEIVRCDRTVNDRTILCQGICSRTLSWLGRATNNTNPFVQSCIPSMNAVHIVDACESKNSSEQYKALFYERLLTFISPEVSVSKENMDLFAKTVNKFRPVTDLASYIMDIDNDYSKESLILTIPTFKYLTIGTQPKQFEIDGDSDYSGGTYFGMFGTHSYQLEIRLYTCEPYNPISTLGVFKFYQPCTNSDSVYSVSPTVTKYVEGLDFNVWDADIKPHYTSIGNHTFCNFGLSNNDDAEGEGSHGPCLVMEFNLTDATQIVKAQSSQDKVAYHRVLRWDGQWDLNEKTVGWYTSIHPTISAIKNDNSIYTMSDNYYLRGDFDDNNRYTDVRELIDLTTLSSNSEVTARYFARLTNSVVLADLYTSNSPYSGQYHSSRVNSTYTSTGQFFECISDVNYCGCYGGDTYNILDTALWQQYNLVAGNLSSHDKATIIVKYPVETSVNLYRAFGPTFNDKPNTVGHFFEPTVAGKFSQDTPYAAYNDAYNAHETNKIHALKSMWDISNQYIPNRIINSETKSTGELTDSFQEYKIANYIDVDNKFGGVTNLVNFNNNLVFFQDGATGYLSVNERSLIEDNQALLLLGTGGVLTAFMYYSQFYGTSVINDTSIAKAPAALYWYDNSRQSIYVLNNSIDSVSLVKGVLTYLIDNTNKETKILHKHKAYSAYDAKNREVWFRLENDNKSLIYSEQLALFVGFYSTPIQHSVTMSDFTVAFTAKYNDTTGDIVIPNIPISIGKAYNNEVAVPKLGDPSITFVVNKNVNTIKVFDAIQTSSSNSTGEVFCDYTFKTNRQKASTVSLNKANKFVEGVCYTYIPRDDKQERLRDRYMTVTMDFDTSEKFYIPSVSTIFRRSLH